MDEHERKSLEIEILSLKKSFSASPTEEISKPNLNNHWISWLQKTVEVPLSKFEDVINTAVSV
jgi:hypothetical protein